MIKVKAIISFAGPLSLNAGDVAEVSEETAAKLINCGLVKHIKEAAENEAERNDGRKNKKSAAN